MLARTVSGGLDGVKGFLVDVEAFLGKGMIGFDIVGLPSTAVKESRDRIRAALINAGYDWPMKKLTINLAPADVKKEGTSLELAIAAALLAAQNPEEYTALDQTLLLGELTLHGELAPVRGVLSMVLAARGEECYVCDPARAQRQGGTVLKRYYDLSGRDAQASGGSSDGMEGNPAAGTD